MLYSYWSLPTSVPQRRMDSFTENICKTCLLEEETTRGCIKIFLKNLFLEKILEKKMTHYSMSHFKLNLFEKIENFYFRIFIRQNHNLA